MKYKNVFGIVGWKNSGKTTLVENLVKNITDQGYKVSIKLNSKFEDDLYKTIKIIKENSGLSRSLKHIVIVNPSPSISIDSFINKQKNDLAAVGWGAMKKTHNDERRGKCANSMYIYPM